MTRDAVPDTTREAPDADVTDEPGPWFDEADEPEDATDTDECDNDSQIDLASEVSRLTDALARTQAEFANYRKRIARDSAAAAERTKAAVLEALVPVFDAFDAAAAHEEGASTAGPLRGALLEAAKRMGLVPIHPEHGEAFDPESHHAVSGPVEVDHDELVVTSVARPGYRIGDHLLRAAEVVVEGRDVDPEAD